MGPLKPRVLGKGGAYMTRFTTGMPAVRALVLALAGLVIAGVPLRAQATAGAISGVVQDAQGAVVPCRESDSNKREPGRGFRPDRQHDRGWNVSSSRLCWRASTPSRWK